MPPSLSSPKEGYTNKERNIYNSDYFLNLTTGYIWNRGLLAIDSRWNVEISYSIALRASSSSRDCMYPCYHTIKNRQNKYQSKTK